MRMSTQQVNLRSIIVVLYMSLPIVRQAFLSARALIGGVMVHVAKNTKICMGGTD